MARIKEFRGLRPARDLASMVAELPYDVVSSAEAKKIAEGNPTSFFHVTKPEIDLPDGTDLYDERVYAAARKNLDAFIRDGVMRQDGSPIFYLYTQVMDGRPQTGLVACAHIDDYAGNIIKKHELTREDKEKDRSRHLDVLDANAGPVFLLFREDGTKRALFDKAMAASPEYDFTAPDGIRHILRVISDGALIAAFREAFKNDVLYIADGHHRAASAVRVGTARRAANPNHRGDEEYNWFLSVIFPHDQLRILPYNRVVRDLNGLSAAEFLKKLEPHFTVQESGVDTPEATHRFSMYLGGRWYTMAPRTVREEDPIASLDVKILQDLVLEPLLGISDPRTDKRIDFIGGIRGTGELVSLVDSGKYAVAFSMYPTTIEQLMRVSDSDAIMPPKSTWFEPKLRSGIVVHLLR